MSKKQEKMQRRIAESHDFLRERRKAQLEVFENNVEAGKRLFEQNKDKLTPEQLATLEAQLAENERLLEELRDKIYPRAEA